MATTGWSQIKQYEEPHPPIILQQQLHADPLSKIWVTSLMTTDDDGVYFAHTLADGNAITTSNSSFNMAMLQQPVSSNNQLLSITDVCTYHDIIKGSITV
eukprot:2163081-Ditylum_brightwellii.AAC.1